MENRRLVSGLQWLSLLTPVGLSVFVLMSLGQIWTARWRHPFDLEWMEGGMLAHAWRLSNGEPLYVAPGPDFIPYIYPPGYAWVLSTLGQFLPLGYPLGRAVSLAGMVMAASAILAFTLRHRSTWMGAWVSGLLGATVFLLAYPDSGAFYDLVRPDSLALGLTAWALVLGLEKQGKWVALGGLMLFASFTMKQNMAVFGVPIVLALWHREGLGRAVWFALWSAGPALLFVGWMQGSTDGHFLRYLLAAPAAHGLKAVRFFPGFSMEIGLAMPLASLFTVLGAALLLCTRWRHRGGLAFVGLVSLGLCVGLLGAFMQVPRGIRAGGSWENGAGFAACAISLGVLGVWALQATRRKRLQWGWIFALSLAVVTVVSVLFMRGHHGGYLNVYMPLHWGLGLSVAVLSTAVLDWVKEGTGERWVGGVIYSAAMLGVLSHGFMQLKPDVLTPTAADVEAGEAWVEALRKRVGPVLSPYAPWLPVQAGHAPSFHLIALWDVDDRQHKGSPYPGVRETLTSAIARGHWPTLVDTRKSMRFGVLDRYQEERLVTMAPGAMVGKTGWNTRPEVIRGPVPKTAPLPIQLPQWMGVLAASSQDSPLVFTLDGQHLWLKGESEPIVDLDAALSGHAERPVRLRSDRAVSMRRLNTFSVHCARSGRDRLELEVLTTVGRDVIPLLTRPADAKPRSLRVVLGEEHMRIVSPEGLAITVPVQGPKTLPEGIDFVAVKPVSGSVQQGVEAVAQALASGWDAVYLGDAWPKPLASELSSAEEVRVFWSQVSGDALESP